MHQASSCELDTERSILALDGVMRTYVIADLHGRFDLLRRAIELIEADAGTDGGTFIVLGDFIDRGPQSRDIIEFLKAGPNLPNWRWIVLQGNHEAMMIAGLANPSLWDWWLDAGGHETLKSYGVQGERTARQSRLLCKHIDWLANLPVFHEDDQRIYVHAGVPSDLLPHEAGTEILQWMRYPSDHNRSVSEIKDDEPHCSGKHVVHGHHQSTLHPLKMSHRTNLDTFAWFSGRLAIGVFDNTAGQPIKIMNAIGMPAARQSAMGRGRGVWTWLKSLRPHNFPYALHAPR